MYDYPDPYDLLPTDDSSAFLAVLFGAILVIGVIAVISYVVTSIFLMKALKAAGHAHPVSAWVPLWNIASLFELGGIRNPWAWIGILFGVSFVGGLIPYVGFLISLAATALSIMLMIWAAKGVQEGSGLNSTGGIVLAVLVPIAWFIWMGVRLPKTGFSPDRAVASGATFPRKWFANSGPDPRAAFPGSRA